MSNKAEYKPGEKPIGPMQYNSQQFYGIIINTGAAKFSTAGHGQL